MEYNRDNQYIQLQHERKAYPSLTMQIDAKQLSVITMTSSLEQLLMNLGINDFTFPFITLPVETSISP